MSVNYIRSQNGFTFIEMSIVILIVSVLIGMAISFALPIIETSRRLETTQKLTLIKEALAEYAVANNRIPCPASAIKTGNTTYGFETGNGTALGLAGFRCASNFGMVPFRTLGISENIALDAWRNPITYAVSPAFTVSTVLAQTSVHINCRTRDWFYANGRPIETDASPVIDVAPINPEKAAFCCAGNPATIGGNLIVLDQAGNNVLGLNRVANLGAQLQTAVTISETDISNITTPTLYPSSASTPTGIAYVLVSHGDNGFRAYELETGTRIVNAASTCEVENGDDNVTFRDCVSNDNSGTATFSDDLTTWATQDEIFASQNESCAVP
jgi:prepilin-type N-terminal cleavage/methylation domain-containing protein